MVREEEDAVCTVLAGARLALAMGGAKRAQEAVGALEELQEKLGATALTLALAGQCSLVVGRLDEAEAALKQSLQRDANCVSALYALHLVLLRQGKHQPAARALAQAKASPQGPSHLAFLAEADQAFDAAAAAAAAK